MKPLFFCTRINVVVCDSISLTLRHYQTLNSFLLPTLIIRQDMSENENFFRYRIFSLWKFTNKPKSYGLWKLWDNFWTCTNPPMHPIADKAKMVISVPLKIQNISSENSGVSYKIKIIFNIYNYINRRIKNIFTMRKFHINLQFRGASCTK